MIRASRISGLVFALLTTLGEGRASFAQTEFPFELHNPRIFGESAELGLPFEAAVARDGSLIVIDWAVQQLLSFSQTGQLQWRSGRKGSGPGEFQQPYRVVPLADGAILVYDLSKPGLTRLNAEGTYRDEVRLDVVFRDVSTMIGLRDGGLAVAGLASPGSPADTNAAVHIFDKEFRFVRSFGPLPTVLNRAVLQDWGVGAVTLVADGSLVFTRRHPYEIYHFTPEGRELSVVRSTLPIVGTPDEALTITTNGTKTTRRVNPKVTLLRPAVMLANGSYLCGRIDPGYSTLDLFAPDGRILGVRKLPDDWKGPVKYDAIRNTLWAFALRDEAPVLLRYTPPERKPNQ